MNVQWRYIVDMANEAAAGELGSIPFDLGGDVKCQIGSAVAHSRIPTAIVVHTVMANQFHMCIKGLASGPPKRIFAIGENKMKTDSMTARKATMVNSHPKFVSTQSFAALVIFAN